MDAVTFAKEQGGDALAEVAKRTGAVAAVVGSSTRQAASAIGAKAAPLLAATKQRYDAVANKYPQFFIGANMDQVIFICYYVIES
jgi:hypothetical protein